MISRWLVVILFAIVFAPGLLHAQDAGSKPGLEPTPLSSPSTLGEPRAPTDFNKMYEDIEILRRILDRKLTPLYPSIPSTGGRTDQSSYGNFSGQPDNNAPTLAGPADASYVLEGQLVRSAQGHILHRNQALYPATIPFRSLEGVYLKGQGVIYTATLSSLQLPARAEADSTVREWTVAVLQQVTEWDSIRRQVRNEKETPKKAEASKPPSLIDVLLKVLADNGHHFSQLGENEGLTLVLTVHESHAPSAFTKTGTGSTRTEANSTPAYTDANFQRDLNNIALLGDLHFKQGKYQDAISAFEKLLELAKGTKHEAQVRRKLAQCYLGLGQDDKARTELEKAMTLTKQETDPKEKQPSANPAAALPVKLIISTPKKLLDQMKEGKVPFEEFRRQASVETLRFGDRR